MDGFTKYDARMTETKKLSTNKDKAIFRMQAKKTPQDMRNDTKAKKVSLDELYQELVTAKRRPSSESCAQQVAEG